ncbi:hypothetical protein CCP3SC15_630016 [Gammaproteobacteria bacterium]
MTGVSCGEILNTRNSEFDDAIFLSLNLKGFYNEEMVLSVGNVVGDGWPGVG